MRDESERSGKMAKIPYGPTYDEMLDPGLLDKDVRERALTALAERRA